MEPLGVTSHLRCPLAGPRSFLLGKAHCTGRGLLSAQPNRPARPGLAEASPPLSEVLMRGSGLPPERCQEVQNKQDWKYKVYLTIPYKTLHIFISLIF